MLGGVERELIRMVCMFLQRGGLMRSYEVGLKLVVPNAKQYLG